MRGLGQKLELNPIQVTEHSIPDHVIPLEIAAFADLIHGFENPLCEKLICAWSVQQVVPCQESSKIGEQPCQGGVHA